MDLVTQVEWRGPNRPSSAAIRRLPAPGIEVHHTVTGRAVTRQQLINIARSIYDNDHVGKRGWSDVFYGWLLGDEHVLEIRGYDHLSGQVPHMTVCLVGNYSTGQDQPTVTQLANIRELREMVVRRGGGTDLTWHSRRDETTCPGGNTIVHLEAMLRRPFPGTGSGPTQPPTPHPTPAPVPAPGEDYAMDRLDLRKAHVTPVRGRHVDNLQALLLAAGVGAVPALVGSNGRPDGIAGPGTRAALGAFQQATGTGTNGLPDYVVGPRTWRALIER